MKFNHDERNLFKACNLDSKDFDEASAFFSKTIEDTTKLSELIEKSFLRAKSDDKFLVVLCYLVVKLLQIAFSSGNIEVDITKIM